MPLVASVDYPGKRIYLSSETVNSDIDTLNVYREVRALRCVIPDHRKFQPIIVAGGNIEKIVGLTYTSAYVQLLHGCRIVPYDASHALRLVRETFTDDGVAGRDCFDRSILSPSVVVDIDVDFPAVEIRTIATSGNEYSLAQIAESVLESIIEQALDLRGTMRLLLSFAAGNARGLDGDNPSFRDLEDTKDRITATMGSDGTRTVTTRDAS